jgi:hypothetical protein
MKDERAHKSEEERSVDSGVETEGAEQEEWDNDIGKWFYDNDCYWLDLFKAEAAILNPGFSQSLKDQTVNLTEGEFKERLSWCLQMVGLSRLNPLPVEMVNELFSMAVLHSQRMSAYLAYRKFADGSDFSSTIEFIPQEKGRIEQISQLLTRPQGTIVPQRLFEWHTVWIESLERLVRLIKLQLIRGEESIARRQRFWLTSGRTHLRSHLLVQALNSIRKLVKDTKPRPDSIALLVAYGHASWLKKYSGRDPVAAMKMRMSRMKKLNVMSQIAYLLNMADSYKANEVNAASNESLDDNKQRGTPPESRKVACLVSSLYPALFGYFSVSGA